LVNTERRKVVGNEAFKQLGYNPMEVEDISAEDLGTYAEGRDITSDSNYAIGQLIQDSKSGGVYFVEQGFKYPIVSKDILKVNFPKAKITKQKTEVLSKFLTGQKVKLTDGTLVRDKKSKEVFVISNGQRRPIANEKTFKQLGYQTKDVLVTTDEVVKLHPLGDPIDLQVGSVGISSSSN
jgi:hypothetical protein